MALTSPGVEVTILDQSQYLPTAVSSVPLLVVASAENKANASGTAVAAGTLAANAGKLYQVTSQRDLVTLFGNPFFYKTTNGTPIQGYELNEYGLLSAYSLLGSTNLCYILRADIDLASLIAKTSRPVGEPTDGTYWLDVNNSAWGLHEFNATSGKFTYKNPLVITSSDDLTKVGAFGNGPKDFIGNYGDYAVVQEILFSDSTQEAPDKSFTHWYKVPPLLDDAGAQVSWSTPGWVPVGSKQWQLSFPMWVASRPFTTTTAFSASETSSLFVMMNRTYMALEIKWADVIAAIAADTTSGRSELQKVVNYLNSDTYQPNNIVFKAHALDGKLAFYGYAAIADSTSKNAAGVSNFGTRLDFHYDGNTDEDTDGVYDSSQPGTSAGDSGITAYTNVGKLGLVSTRDFGTISDSTATWLTPVVAWTAANAQPQWRSTDNTRAPSGSLWIKTTAQNLGMNVVMSKYSSTSGTWSGLTVNTYGSDMAAIADLDSTGGKAIKSGTVYAQVNALGSGNSPVQLWKRGAQGSAVYTGTKQFTADSSGNYPTEFLSGHMITVNITTPGNTTMTSYPVTLKKGTQTTTGLALTVADVLTSWQLAQIPSTTIAINSDGYVEITHTEGGVIDLDDSPSRSSETSPTGNANARVWLYDTSATLAAGPLQALGFSAPNVGAQRTYIKFGQPNIRYFKDVPSTQMTIPTGRTAPTLFLSTLGYGLLTNGGVIYNSDASRGDNAIWGLPRTSNDGTAIVSTLLQGGTGFVAGDLIKVNGAFAYGDTVNSSGVWSGDGLTFRVLSATAGVINAMVLVKGAAQPQYATRLSNWLAFDYLADDIAPNTDPAEGTYWFNGNNKEADILVNKFVRGVGASWVSYRMTAYASNGKPVAADVATAPNGTDPNGPIMSASEPLLQSTGAKLAWGDLWVDTNDLENYPVIRRWEATDVNPAGEWVLIDNTDQLTENGIVFADARWGGSGAISCVDDAVPTIKSLLTNVVTSNGVTAYVDLDAPDPALYPQGTLLWNTRRSGYVVKQFRANYFTNSNYPAAGAYVTTSPTNTANLPRFPSAWVTVSGNKSDGSPYMGRKAQRAVIVSAMKSALDTNVTVREEDTFFNLLAAPGYPELQPNMVSLNNDRNQTAYIVGDTPLRLADDANAINAWAKNSNGATATGEDGLVTRDTYLGIYYPSGITTDLTGSEVVVPASHMVLRTMLYNDTVAYPWFAPAGQRRGIIDNATNIGYIDSESGEFKTTKNRVSLRDVEYSNFINPIAYFTNIGLLNFGNKNSFDSQSALDRTNVARLVAYLRERLQVAVRPFLFEPNDNATRNEVKSVINSLLADVQTKRGIYDYLVVCDGTNNTPARIDRNELWIDIAIEPVKAVEFIYIPVRILNTGEIAGL